MDMEIEAPTETEAAAEERKAREIEIYGEVAERFHEFDADGSGFLDEAEVMAFCKSLGLDFTAEQGRAALDEMEMDATRDGLVSLEEFAYWWSTETATKVTGTVAGMLAAAREVGVKPSELKKMEANAKIAIAAGSLGSGVAVEVLTSGDTSARGRWKRAGVQTRMQLAVMDAFRDSTGKRPSDMAWKEWVFRDWPVWQCSKPTRDLAVAEARARKSIIIFVAAVLPAAIVFGVFALRTASDSDEHPSCVHHSVSRITRLTEIGLLWIICSVGLTLGVGLEISSRMHLANFITGERAQMNTPAAGGAPRSRGGGESPAAVRCSAAMRLGFTISAFLGSLCYLLLFCYALTLTALMMDVCEGNFWPLAGYVLLLWLWLTAALFTGVPIACLTWLRWHGCSAGDTRALLYPTRYPVPPVPETPPLVRRLPQEARVTSDPSPSSATPSAAANVTGVLHKPPPLGALVGAGRGGQGGLRAAVRLASPTRRPMPGGIQATDSAAPLSTTSGSKVMAAAARINQIDSTSGSGLTPGARRKAPPSLENLQRSRTPPRLPPSGVGVAP